jgi:serine/threonine protein kinase
LAYTQTGTPYYASPEVWADKPYDYTSDLWSIGVILYELCTLNPPFKGANLKELYKSVTKGEYEPISSSYSKDLSTIVQLLLQTNPKKRPNCDKILAHPLIEKRVNKNLGVNKLNLIPTIKCPLRLSEMNNILPKRSFSLASQTQTLSTQENESTTTLNSIKNCEEQKHNINEQITKKSKINLHSKGIPPQKCVPASLRSNSSKPIMDRLENKLETEASIVPNPNIVFEILNNTKEMDPSKNKYQSTKIRDLSSNNKCIDLINYGSKKVDVYRNDKVNSKKIDNSKSQVKSNKNLFNKLSTKDAETGYLLKFVNIKIKD